MLAKVGEASLKGRNRRRFLDALRRNLKAALAGLDARIETGGSVLVIAGPRRARRGRGRLAARARLRVCGRLGLPALRARPEQIADVAMLAFERARPATFAVRVRRRDKTFPLTSQDLEREIGAAIQQRTGAAGRSQPPGARAARRARRRTAPTCTCASSRPRGGLPVGTSGRALSLLSGGIDSPVAVAAWR